MLNKFKTRYPNINVDEIVEKGKEIDGNNPEFIHNVYHNHLN